MWDNEINSDENQKESELKIIENMKISINQIISVYDHYEGDNIINDEFNELKEKDDISNKLLSFNQEKEIKSDETNPEQNYNDDLDDDNNNSESESNSYANNDDDERE